MGLSLSTVSAQDDAPRPRVKMTTSLGIIVVELYNETPQHRDNFLKLAGEGFYDGTLFHRVISGFICRETPNPWTPPPERVLGTGGPGLHHRV